MRKDSSEEDKTHSSAPPAGRGSGPPAMFCGAPKTPPLLGNLSLPFPEEIRAEKTPQGWNERGRTIPKTLLGGQPREKQGCQYLWSTCVGCLWHQGDAASSTASSQGQTFPAFRGSEFSPCFVSRAGKPGTCGAFTRLSCFAAFLPSRATEWLSSGLNCSCVPGMEKVQAAKGTQCCWEWGIPSQWGF